MHKWPASAALVATVLVSAGPALGQPDGFIEETVVGGLTDPVGLAFAPDGRYFVWEKGGRVWIVEDGAIQQLFLDLREETNTYWTRGMTGFALDPDFERNGYVYLMFTVDWEYYITRGNPNPGLLDTNHDTFGRLVRFTADPDDDFTSVIPGSRWDMIGASHDNGFPVTLASHTQNSIVFAPDGTMLISAGDGASMLGVDVGGPRSPCCSSNTAEADGIISLKEQIGAYRAQLVDTHAGKILRIDSATAEGLPSNPFYDGSAPSAPRSRVWAMGLRNPYTFSVRPGTGSDDPADGDPGVLMIGDVGWDTWERLVVAVDGGRNFGWPVYEGLVSAAGYPGLEIENLDAPNPMFDGFSCMQEFFHFTDLLVQETLNAPSWPNPCNEFFQIPAELTFMHTRAVLIWRNARVFPTPFSMVPAFDGGGNAIALSIAHPESSVEGPHLRGVATIGGVFYDGDKFPEAYQGSYFFAEAGGDNTPFGWINRATFGDRHELTVVETFRPTGSLLPTTLAVDPDGYGLYYAHHATNGSIRRITFDCNDTGVADDVEIEQGLSDDVNGDGIPDECRPPADINGDGVVDVDDLVTVILSWGPCAGTPCPGDVNGDGAVDVDDLVLVILGWG